MYLSDVEIQNAIRDGELIIDPFDTNMLESTTVNLHLAETLHVPKDFPSGTGLFINNFRDARPQEFHDKRTLVQNHPYPLSRHDFVLGLTLERVGISPSAKLMGFIEGRSGVARHGVIVHCSAPIVHPGWNGQLTLEIVNLGPHQVPLNVGESICQIAFARLGTPSSRPYPGTDTPQFGYRR